jgi:hypothetical protein
VLSSGAVTAKLQNGRFCASLTGVAASTCGHLLEGALAHRHGHIVIVSDVIQQSTDSSVRMSACGAGFAVHSVRGDSNGSSRLREGEGHTKLGKGRGLGVSTTGLGRLPLAEGARVLGHDGRPFTGKRLPTTQRATSDGRASDASSLEAAPLQALARCRGGGGRALRPLLAVAWAPEKLSHAQRLIPVGNGHAPFEAGEHATRAVLQFTGPVLSACKQHHALPLELCQRQHPSATPLPRHSRDPKRWCTRGATGIGVPNHVWATTPMVSRRQVCQEVAMLRRQQLSKLPPPPLECTESSAALMEEKVSQYLEGFYSFLLLFGPQ